MNKKVLIIGASGMIGGALYRLLSRKNYNVFGADKELLAKDFISADITRKDTLEKVISEIKPDVLILTAALSHVDYCEEFPEESERVNIQGLRNVINCLDGQKNKIVFFSSDYVFDGLNGPYSENDKPNPINVYGRHKLAAEEIIKQAFRDYLIIRTTNVYGPDIRGKNFVLSTIQKLKEGETVKLPFDQISSPTYSENLAEIIEELLREEKKGIYNIVGSELIDRYSFGREICNTFGFPENMLVSVFTQELGQKAKRPLKAGLKTDKVKKEISIKLLNYKDGLKLMKNKQP